MASGTVSFGLVAIPIKLYSTGEAASAVSFSMVHRSCGTKVNYRYYCPTDDKLVEREELAKGYEFAKGRYVLFTEEELKALLPEPTNAIEITEFVPASQVDPLYFERSYYLGPDKGGARPYRLLAQAMQVTGRAALARYAARGKNYLVLLRPFEGGIIMQQLRYADEIKSFAEVPLGEAEIKDPELKLAVQLVEQIAADTFRPEAYEDEVRKQIQGLIQQKVEGEEITAAPQAAPKAQIIDLMEALKASLGGDAGAQRGAAKGRKPPRRAAAEEAAPAAKRPARAKKAAAR